jgi:hypothetical protein
VSNSGFNLSKQDWVLIQRQENDHTRASAGRGCDFQLPAHLFNPLTHPGETQAVISIFEFESGAIIT